MMTRQGEGKEYVFLSIIGRDRPGIVASVSKVLYQNRYNVEALSQTAMLGQFAMILIAFRLKRGDLRIPGEELRPLTRRPECALSRFREKASERRPFSAVSSAELTSSR